MIPPMKDNFPVFFILYKYMHRGHTYVFFPSIFNLENITHADKLVSISDRVPDFNKYKLLHVSEVTL